jgi:two-component system phosphate regulon sensor histidine kinase PhoR
MKLLLLVNILIIFALYYRGRVKKKTALELAKQERKFFYLLEEGVLFLNEGDAGIECNRACCRILGCSPSDLLHHSFLSLKSGLRPEVLAKCQEVYKRAKSSTYEIREVIAYKTDKETTTIEVVFAKLSLYETVLILKETYHDENTFKMGKEFIANASHELRTPITIIKGFIETLKDLPEISDAMLEDIFDKILRSCQRMDDIVKNLLILTDLDHLFKPMMKSFDLVALLDNCKHSIVELHPEAQVDLIASHKEKMTEADPSLLELALMNLLQNAIKYSPAPAKIQIYMEDKERESLIKIIDHGYGIPQESLPHIFNRFYSANKTLSRKLGGAGLGLSIVKNIIEKHQGHITAEPNPLGGTIFTVVLPSK